MRAAHLSNENAGRIDSDRTWDYDYLYEWSGRKRAPSQHHDRPKDREDATGEKGKGGKGTSSPLSNSMIGRGRSI
jgi:hypothetical protein